MNTCTTIEADRFRCPRKWDLWRQIIALLPRGRAWQTHEAGAELIRASESSQAGVYEIGSTGLGTEPVVERLTVLQQFWAAFAEVLEHLHLRACALVEEFFCDTMRETAPEWAVEYGYPDGCEPWDSICAKVRAQGGSTCAYLAGLAARLGWSIRCGDCSHRSTADRAGNMQAGCASACGCAAHTIYITVVRIESPAWMAPGATPQLAGRMMAGCNDGCPPEIDPLRCLIERYKPAHVKAIYEVI